MNRRSDRRQLARKTGILAGICALILSLFPLPAMAGPSGVAGSALFQQFPILYQGVLVEGMGGAKGREEEGEGEKVVVVEWNRDHGVCAGDVGQAGDVLDDPFLEANVRSGVDVHETWNGQENLGDGGTGGAGGDVRVGQTEDPLGCFVVF